MSGVKTTESARQLYERVRDGLISFDVYTLGIMIVYSVLAVLFYPYVTTSSVIILQNLMISTAIAALILVWSISGHRLFELMRRLYVIPVIYLMYNQVHSFVRVVHPRDYDEFLIAVDRAIFGGDPTHILSSMATPLLTEYLQLCYVLFYLLPILHAVELWKTGNLERLDCFIRAMTFCYFISYLLYFVMPAVGPRFTLHAYQDVGKDLPGLILTPALRGFVDVGGGIPIGATDPVSVVNRDCMPSGHTWLTLVNIIMAFRFKSKSRWIFLVIGGSLIFSTVYLRYHYVVDIIVGTVFALVTLPLEPYANTLVSRLIRRLRRPQTST